jgi:hypothetical protein
MLPPSKAFGMMVFAGEAERPPRASVSVSDLQQQHALLLARLFLLQWPQESVRRRAGTKEPSPASEVVKDNSGACGEDVPVPFVKWMISCLWSIRGKHKKLNLLWNER